MEKPLHIALVAGEMSGDALGAGMMREIRALHENVTFSGMGGERMAQQGLDSLYPMERLSVMGLVEPLKRLPELLRIRAGLYRHCRANPPDVFVGIDSPDFCLGLEARLRRHGIPTVHYVSPSVWAWRGRRIRTIARSVDLMLTLFPFEVSIYARHLVPVRYVGHPLADRMPWQVDVEGARNRLGLTENTWTLALLPGSRQEEVARLAPPFLATAAECQRQWDNVQVILSAASEARREELQTLLKTHAPGLEVRLVTGNSHDVMAAADQLLVASGTVTLEALLLKKPMVVCYRMAGLSHAIISRMLKVPYFSLPNLLARQALVPEYVQEQVNPATLFAALARQREDRGERERLREEYQRIHERLAQNADRQAAEAVLEMARRGS